MYKQPESSMPLADRGRGGIKMFIEPYDDDLPYWVIEASISASQSSSADDCDLSLSFFAEPNTCKMLAINDYPKLKKKDWQLISSLYKHTWHHNLEASVSAPNKVDFNKVHCSWC